MKRKYKLFLFFDLVFFCLAVLGFYYLVYREKNLDAKQISEDSKVSAADKEFAVFQKAYPNVNFSLRYDEESSDWILAVKSYGKTTEFFRCEGKYLTKENLPNKNHFWRVLYSYHRTLRDPDFNKKEDGLGIPVIREQEWAQIRKFSSASNRRNGTVSSKEIFNAIYDSRSRGSTEKHIKKITLFGKPSRVHEMIIPALTRVEKKVYELSKTDKDVTEFLRTLESAQAYNWREIRDSNTRSFHSYGIAVDVLPRNWWPKIVYWGFERQKGNPNWMAIPLAKRWSPPKSVIKAFEDEGFIWGGRWVIWDNMHFEYHPEMFLTK